MAKRSVLRLDNKLQDTYSVRVPAGQEFENGFVAKLGDVEKANLDVHGVAAPASGDSVVLIGNPAIVYDNARPGTGLETEYFMKADEVVRAYKPEVNKLISISLEGFVAEPAEGDIVAAAGGYKLATTETPATTGFTAKVVKIETVGGVLAVNVGHSATTYAVLEVLSV